MWYGLTDDDPHRRARSEHVRTSGGAQKEDPGAMPARSVTERLRAGEVLLMDGGTGSELQRRGVEVLLGSRGDKLGPWSATANLDAPDVVQQVHQDYLRVGADVIISNNFRTTRTRLAPVGLGDRWQEYAEAGGQLAVAARNRINPDAYVAGGMAAPGLAMLQDRPGTDVELMGEAAYRPASRVRLSLTGASTRHDDADRDEPESGE